MNTRRVGALALAVALIGGAYLIRSRVIEDGPTDTSDSTTSNGPATMLICIDEFRSVCLDLTDIEGLTVVTESAEATLTRMRGDDAASIIWLTLEPFPEMAAELRSLDRLPPIDTTSTDLATSPLVAVVRSSDTSDVVDRCASPDLEFVCLGQLDDLSPTFAPTSSAVGSLGIASALVAFGGGSLDTERLDLLTWAGPLKRSGARSLSGGTAVATIQTRPTFGIAIGAEAELSSAKATAFDVLYAEPMIHLDAQLMVPSGSEVSDGLTSQLTTGLLAAGWTTAEPDRQTGLPAAGAILAARSFWEDL